MIRRFLLACLLGCTLAAFPVRALGEEEGAGEPWAGGEAVRNSTATLMFDQNSRGPETREERRQPYFLRRFDRLQVNPDSPRVTTWPPENAPLAAEPAAAVQTAGVNFTGATLADTSAFPPDTMGAVGPAQFIVAVNGRIRSFTKSGAADGVLNIDTDVFFSSVMTPPVSNNFTSDPRIRYDRLSHRWFIIIIDVPGRAGALPNRVMIAVSDGPVITPTTVWSFYQFQHDLVSPAGDTGKFADYPTLGIDANALYIGVNVFNTSGTGGFFNTTAFVVRKSSLLTNGPIVVTAFRSLVGKGQSGGPYTPQGVDNYDPTATEGYFIGVDSQFYGKLQLRRISDPAGTPTISANVTITVPANGGTMTVPHLGNTGGSSGNLDGLDYRLMSAHIRNGRLWTTENMAVDNTGAPGGTDTRNAVRWYELQGIPTGQTPSVVQSGTLYQPSASNTSDQRHYWMGTIMVSGQGHAAMGFSVAGANERINAGTAGRLASDPLGTLQTPVLYTATSSSYNPPSDSGGSSGRRWGDYSYTSLDPNDDMTMWTIQEFCDSPDSYGVRVLQLLAPPPATPVGCNPSTIAAGATNVSVTVTGMVLNGTGFFEPGVGFSNHLSAAISGSGVTVTSITYNNPSNIVLRLSVASSAQSGGRTITVINPDGQTASSSATLLTITGGSASNSPPTLATITNVVMDEMTQLTITASATDPNGDSVAYSLGSGAPTNAAIDAATGVFTWTPSEAQGPSTNAITIVATDNGTPPLSNSTTFTIVVREVNRAPLMATIGSRSVPELNSLSVTPFAIDQDVPANVLAWTLSSAPSGMTINATNGAIAWTPTEAQGPSTNIVTVIATDNGVPPLSATQSFTVTVSEVNSAPTLAAIGNRSIPELTTLFITNSATDIDSPPNVVRYSLDQAPAGMAVDTNSGVISWTPSEAQGPSTNVVIVRVTDNGAPSLSATQMFSVVVSEVNSAPTLAPVADIVTAELSLLVITNSTTDADLPANVLRFELLAAPAGMALDTNNGVITWTPTEAQGPSSNTVSVRVTDNGVPPMSATQSFTVVVTEVNSAPMLALTNAIIPELSEFVLTNYANDSDLPANTLFYELLQAPTGILIETNTGTIRWTPSEAQGPSTNTVTVRVTDDGTPALSTTQSVTIVVSEVNSAPLINAASNLTVFAGAMVTQPIIGSDADQPVNALTYSIDAAPSGATISSNGVFTWNTTNAPAGDYVVTVRVTDDGSPALFDTTTFHVVVSELRLAPVSVDGTNVVLRWAAEIGRTYRVEAASNLTSPVWAQVSTNVTATTANAELQDSAVGEQRFYRVVRLEN